MLRDLTVGSTMGFAVLAKISYYRALIAEVVRWVGEHRPRAVCFVDSSGLNLRIAAGLFARGFSAKAGGPTKALYYISPQLWASRAGRRFAMAKHLDGVAAIFPFEPAVYADTTLPVEFVVIRSSRRIIGCRSRSTRRGRCCCCPAAGGRW